MSGRKSVLTKYAAISAGDASGDLTSAITNTQFLDEIGYQCDISGTPTGSLEVQVSANYEQDTLGNVLNAGTWISILTQAITGGSPATTYFDVPLTSAPWMRLKYVSTSGTGTLDVVIVGKMV